MIDLFKFFSLIIGCCFISETNAQAVTDTLQLSKNYSEQNDFSRSISLLKTYTSHHANDSNALQLLGLNYYWGGRYNEADSFYKKQMEVHPQMSNLKMDYARMLYERNKLRRAKPILEDFLLENPKNVEALVYLGYINYWNGEYKAAQSNFDHILQRYPDNSTALEMAETIKLIVKPYFFTFHEYSYDSQPLTSGISTIETGRYFSPVLNPVIRANYLYFISDSLIQVPWFQVANEFSFFKNKTHLNAEIGMLRNVLSETETSGLLELTQRITDKLSVRIAGKSRPYFYTLGSMAQAVSFNAVNASILMNSPKGINLQLFGEKQFFMDDNEISNSFLWIISPSFGWNALKFNLGYGYSYTDAVSNKFYSVQSLQEILTDYQEGEIEGVYNPYFTPENQHIHTAIGSIALSVKNDIEFVLKGNVGFYAFADIPYLYLDKDIQNTLFINKGYSKETKVPYEVSGAANWYIKRNITLNAKYIYTENFFYYNNVFNLSFKYIFH